MKLFIVGLFVMTSAFAQENTIVISGADKLEKALTAIDHHWDGLRAEETTEGYICTKNLLNHGQSRVKLIVGKALTSISVQTIKETRSTTTVEIKTFHGASSEVGSKIQCSASRSSEVMAKLATLKD